MLCLEGLIQDFTVDANAIAYSLIMYSRCAVLREASIYMSLQKYHTGKAPPQFIPQVMKMQNNYFYLSHN
jgi:hypothetical protein